MIIGHQKQLSSLRQMVESDNFPHALLFCGEDGLGKKKVALEFIKIVNCEKSKNAKSPCGKCQACLDIEKGKYEDFIIVEPRGKEIQIGQIREIINITALTPSRSLFKFVLIKEAHLMNQAAQTALLKTLEEPQGRTIFILITAYPEKLLLTILSRLQRIKFYKVATSEIEKALAKDYPKEAKDAALLSFGRPQVALNLLRDDGLKKELAKREDFIKFIYNTDLADKFNYVKDLVPKEKEGEANISSLLEDWLRYFREILMLKLGLGYENILPGIKKAAEKYTVNQLKEIIKLTQKIKFLTESTNVSSKLALEIIMLKL